MTTPPRRSARTLLSSLLVAATVTGVVPLTAAQAASTDSRPPAPPVEWREGFDGLRDTLRPRVSDPGIAAGALGYSHQGPRGWRVENDASIAEGGVEEWRGWSFTDRDFWTDAEDQMRGRFGRAQGVIAVADSDEYDDLPAPDHTYDTTLVSPSIRVHRQSRLQLGFDSHYRQWAGQSATVTVEFDGDGREVELVTYDSASVADGYDGRLANANESVTFDVPDGARRAVFRWRFTAERNSWYWAIDNVRLQRAQPAVSGDPTSVWVVSDIQGHPRDLAHGLVDLHAARPDAAALLMVGDMVNTGAAAEWDEVQQVMVDRAGIRPPLTVAAIGNHERYAPGGWPVLRQRFLDFADRDQVWGEYLVRGAGVDVPVLVLGQDAAGPTDVPISDEQMSWFRERLQHWTEQQRQVLVATHFPLGDTVSASWIPWYAEHHQRNDELTDLLGSHPNAVVLSGHTHYPLELGDWAVQRRTDSGHPDGFWAVNTGAMHVEWDARGESTAGIREVVTRDINRGLTIDAYPDRLVVQARDFGVAGADGGNQVNDVIREVEIPNPFLTSRYWR